MKKTNTQEKNHTTIITIFSVFIFISGITSVLVVEVVSKNVRIATNLSSYKIHGYIKGVHGNAVLAGFYEVLLYTKQSEGVFSSFVKDNDVGVASGMPANFSFEDWSYGQTFIISISERPVIADNRYVNALIINKEGE